jgi:hypothetical protein
MDFLIPLTAFVLTLAATTRSLGLGLGAAIAVGYFNGVFRANFLGVFSTFMFDAGLLGLYAGVIVSHWHRMSRLWVGTGAGFVLFLILWPVVLTAIPVNDFLVQLVALRATIWFLPVLLIASRMTAADVTMLARVLAVMNVVALAGGFYVYTFGVEAVYPRNAVTEIIYKSKDVGGNEYYRIPSTFLSAHAYGGTMLYTLPFLLGLLFGPGVRRMDRALAAAGTAAAMAGILLCAARMPVVIFGLATLVAWVCTRFNVFVGGVAVGLVVTTLAVALTDERLQRATSLDDTEAVSERVRGSANESFFELLVDYPLGAGMGSSAGTSIPYFLADRAPVAIGLENEFSHIQINQGWVGLAVWLVFLVWMFAVPPLVRLEARWGLGVVLMYGLCLPIWATGFVGTGALSAVPQSVVLLVMMGLLFRIREGHTAKEDDRP